MPEDRVKGMDVSHWTGLVNWQEAKRKSGIEFGITKASQGDSYIDDTFDPNWTAMRRAGLIRGAYHFFEPKVDPTVQADYFLNVIGDILHETDLPPILDVEHYPQYIRQQYDALSVSARRDRVQRCLRRLEEVSGRKPILYTSQGSWRTITGDSQAFKDYPLWVANYGVLQPNVPANNWGGNGWFMWQYSGSGTVAGANASVDLNWFNGSLEELQEFVGFTGPRPVPSQVTNGEMHMAFIRAASSLGVSTTTLLSKAGVIYVQSSAIANRPYDGLALAETNLSQAEKQAIEAGLKDMTPVTPEGIPAGFTNQDMINAFYNAAAKLFIDGWTLIGQAGLLSLGDDRNALYIGPTIDKMSLPDVEKTALRETLGIKTEPPAPIYPYPGLSNQDMINAFYRAGSKAGENYWEWVVSAGLESIAASRNTLYVGPVVDNLPLSTEQKNALKQELGVEPEAVPVGPPYTGLTNQGMINAFFNAAKSLNQPFWEMIERAQLAHMAVPTENRTRLYTGPKIEDLPGLNKEEKTALKKQIS